MKRKGTLTTIILLLVLLIGLSLLLYPTVSDIWNSRVQTRAVASYTEMVHNLDEDKYSELWEAAWDYNKSLVLRDNPYLLSDEQKELYPQLLNIGSDGVLGYIQIPTINVTLPIYHGTEEAVLQVAIGHLEWTSLPAGGANSHCVVSGHRGLPSARLFTDLDQLVVGDYFTVNVLDETLTYEVDQIRIVLPDETEELLIKEGKDLFTLVTCTPYGVNSHRLLVRGHRVDNLEKVQEVRVTADAVIIEKLVVAPFVLAPILLFMLIALLIPNPKKKKRRKAK